MRMGQDHRVWPVDAGFPKEMDDTPDLWAVDEGTADALYGLVRSLRPMVCLETGTHKGRSTRAIASALEANHWQEVMPGLYTMETAIKGHLWTVDMDDYQIHTSGALRAGEQSYVTQVVGKTPGVLAQAPLDTLDGIEFALLDGDHTVEGVDAELAYIEMHRAPFCLVVIENAADAGFPRLRDYCRSYRKHPCVTLPTCCGLTLITMRS